MSDNPPKKSPRKPISFGHRGGQQRPAGERPLPGPTYAAPIDPDAITRRKRTVGISLALAGVGAFGLYSNHRREQCLQQNPQNPELCRSSSTRSSSSSSRLFSSGSSSSTRTATSTTSRGGFGSFFRSSGG